MIHIAIGVFVGLWLFGLLVTRPTLFGIIAIIGLIVYLA